MLRTINGVRRILYRAASILGDINAIARGPKAILKRIVRKQINRQVGKATRWP
jgi:hypothetical protein